MITEYIILTMTQIAVAGAGGRMGKALIEALAQAKDLHLCCALERADSELLGQDSGAHSGIAPNGLPFVDTPNEGFDVLIDFSRPDALAQHLGWCTERGSALVLGTTGLDEAAKNSLKEAGQRIPIVYSPNMSVGVNLCFRLLESAAKILGEDYDVEVSEHHHRYKVDAPSGTALRMGEIIAKARGVSLADRGAYDRHGTDNARKKGEIGFAVTRGGDSAGEHSVWFSGDGERVEISHRAGNRAAFALGALRACRWLEGRGPGLYDMGDVLDF